MRTPFTYRVMIPAAIAVVGILSSVHAVSAFGSSRDTRNGNSSNQERPAPNYSRPIINRSPESPRQTFQSSPSFQPRQTFQPSPSFQPRQTFQPSPSFQPRGNSNYENFNRPQPNYSRPMMTQRPFYNQSSQPRFDPNIQGSQPRFDPNIQGSQPRFDPNIQGSQPRVDPNIVQSGSPMHVYGFGASGNQDSVQRQPHNQYQRPGFVGHVYGENHLYSAAPPQVVHVFGHDIDHGDHHSHHDPDHDQHITLPETPHIHVYQHDHHGPRDFDDNGNPIVIVQPTYPYPYPYPYSGYPFGYPYSYEPTVYTPPQPQVVYVPQEPQVVYVPQDPQIIYVPEPDSASPPPPAAPDDTSANPPSYNPSYNPYDETRSLTALPADARKAIVDIQEAWVLGDLSLIQRHVYPGLNIDIYKEGKYDYAAASGDYIDMTRKALGAVVTQSFTLDQSVELLDGRIRACGKHVFTDPNDQRTTVYVCYWLQLINGQWDITAIDSSSNEDRPIIDPAPVKIEQGTPPPASENLKSAPDAH